MAASSSVSEVGRREDGTILNTNGKRVKTNEKRLLISNYDSPQTPDYRAFIRLQAIITKRAFLQVLWKKREERKLEEQRRLLQAQSNILQNSAESLRTEVLALKHEMLRHASCRFPPIDSYIVGAAAKAIP